MITQTLSTISGWLAGSPQTWALIGVAGFVLYLGCVGLMLHIENATHEATQRLGHEQAYKRFSKFAASLMALNSACLFLVPIATAGSLSFIAPITAFWFGAALVIIGTGTKMWAEHTLGNDGMFWRDMFMPVGQQRIVLDKSNLGPYRYLKNPMYGIGNLHGIGWALLWGSWIGIIVAAAEMICLFTFYYLVELPHIKRVRQMPAAVEK